MAQTMQVSAKIAEESTMSTADAQRETQVMAIAAIVSGGVMGSSLLAAPFDGLVDLYALIVDLPDLGAEPLVDTRTESLAREMSFQDAINEPGSAKMTLEQGAPVGHGCLATLYYRDNPALTMIMERRVATVTDASEENAYGEAWSGRGHLALLERAVVYPAGGVGRVPIVDDRAFNWTSPDYDDSAWINAKELIIIGFAKNIWAGLDQEPDAAKDFADDAALVLWADPYTYITAPPGQCFFRQTFTVPNTGSYVITVIMDDWGSVYLDGQKLADQMSNFIQAQTYQVQLSAGTHLIAANVLNFFVADPDHNPGGFAFSVADNLNGRPGTVHAHSDASCKIVPYADEPPGMTPGRVIRLVIEEAQARGCFVYIGLGFDDVLDSNGAPWPTVADIATRVGNDYLSFLRELTGTYIDLWMPPTQLTIMAYNIGTRGITSVGELHSETAPGARDGNLTLMKHTEVI